MNEKYFWIGLLALIALGPFVGQNYLLHVLILCFIWSMKGYNWSGHEHVWKHDRSQYGAIHFHDDEIGRAHV